MPADLTDDDWNSYRDTIRSLYITENRKLQGPGGVMQEMSTEHGFNATKAQYERRLKKWRFQKNKTKEDWEAIALKVTKRKRDNKESEVRIGGEVVPVKKLRKELSRYGYEAAFPHKFQASTPETPEGFHVCTPPFFQATTCLRNLPWFRFLAMIESKVSPYPDLVSITTNIVSSSTSTTILSQSKGLPMLEPMHTEFEKITSVLQTWATTKTLASQSNTLKLVQDRLRAIIPGDFDKELSVGTKNTRGLIKIDGNVQYLSLTVYLLANNNLDIEIVAAVAELFQDKRSMQLLRRLLSIRIPTVEAFAEKLFLGATKSRYPSIIQECINAGVDPDSHLLGRTALQYVSGKGDIELAQVLLAAGADVNAPPAYFYGRTALQAAAERGNIELVQVLLGAGADVNAWPAERGGRTVLQAAAKSRNIELVQVLLAAGANVNALPAYPGGKNALQAAAKSRNIELVQVLLAAGADVNAPLADGGGRTVLQAAAERGNIELVQVLLGAGADVNAPPADGDGRTALQAAAERGNIELVQVLLGAGADVNAPPADESGRTALQAAVERGNIELVQVLLAAGANVNAPPADIGGVTSLQAAALSGYVRVATMLLDAGADTNGNGALKDGRTALEAAAEHGHIDMVQLLLDAGADLYGNGHIQYQKTNQLALINGHNAVRRLIEDRYKSGIASV